MAPGHTGNHVTGTHPPSPQFIRQARDFSIGGGGIRQCFAFDRFGADNRGAGSHQFPDFFEHGQRDHLTVRNEEHAIVDAIGQEDPAIPHGGALDQGFLGNHIVVVTGPNVRGINVFMLRKVRNVIAVIIEDIGGKIPLLQQPLAAVDVAEERPGFLPPGDFGIHVRTGEILLAGQARFIGRANKRMPDKHVQPLAQRLVERRFEIAPDGFLPMRSDVGKPLGKDIFVAVGMRGAGGLFHKKTVVVANPVGPGPGPEFAHGRVVPAEAALGINRHGMGAATFGMDANAVGVGAVAEQPVMIVNRQITEGFAVVKQEPVAGFATVDDATGQDGQPGEQIITATFLKFFAEQGRPVGEFDFPTVGMQIFQRFAGQRPGVQNEGLNNLIPVMGKGGGAIHIQGETTPAVAAGGNIGVVAHGVTEPEHLPVNGGRGPMQRPRAVEVGGQIHNFGDARLGFAGGGRVFGKERRGVWRGKRHERFLEGFLLPVFQTGGMGGRIGRPQFHFGNLDIARRLRIGGIISIEKHHAKPRAGDGIKLDRGGLAVRQRKRFNRTKRLAVGGHLQFAIARTMFGASGQMQFRNGDRPGIGQLQPGRMLPRRALTGFGAGGNPKGAGITIGGQTGGIIRLTGTGAEGGSGQVIRRRCAPHPIGDHITVPVKMFTAFGFRQFQVNRAAAAHTGFGPDIFLGGILGGNHRPAEIPATLDVQTDFQAQPVGFAQGMLVQLAPFGGKKRGTMRHRFVPLLRRTVGVKNDGTGKSFGLHLFEVMGNGSLGHVAVEPPPIGAQARLGGRVIPALHKIIRANRQPGRQQQRAQRDNF